MRPLIEQNLFDSFQGQMEFHVAAKARDYYQFDQALFSSSGNVVFADFSAARRFATAMNAKRDLVGRPESAVSPGQLAAMGLIDEMLHVLIAQYREQNPQAMQQALSSLEGSLGSDLLDQALQTFAQEFPPVRVYQGQETLEAYLAGSTEGRPNREIALEEMLLLWMANANPAFEPFLELFDDQTLEQYTVYLPIIENLEAFFEGQPALAETGASLFKSLRMPALSHPGSLDEQLEFLLRRFGGSLGRFMVRVLTSRDVLREEGRRFDVPITIGAGGGDGVSVAAFDFKSQSAAFVPPYEPEAFSPDLDWMPNCVLLAKNAFVWLDQLSKKYKREIQTLDQIPDAELDELKRWGVTGLWLIGLWERSTASKTIKQRMGNPDAVASAYSLYDYVIARDLGGEPAVEVLRQKAWQRGIRLASDMVPNHVGIDGRWVIEHPDWFLSLPYPPYPSYTFNGPDLSNDSRVGVFLEDHYYDKSDAAVVFKRLDRHTGSEMYIYHGNDGTAMPWNDTAQLNYLSAAVREGVIQTILHVARQFPIIRFDAAMTLAKRHIQRLWFPPPGGSQWGVSIPSRAEHALTQEQFDALIPEEFWREVVDRCAVEAPNTLLLAEAFWMMEGYFVRSLGMHRVYNSAFMVMLRDEKNQEYRQIIKNTLEFEPEIMKRYVNFLNNPDEKTAEEQFGKSDKYFGVMTLCATLPGLPMLGHGQVEGFTERYGMEYRRAYYDETPDFGLVEYHHQQIFPLLKKRYLFAEVENFILYDFKKDDGSVDENVYAYSNRTGAERALVVYNNQNHSTKGRIALSINQPVKTGHEREMRQRNLGESLGLSYDANTWSIFRDQVNGLEYLRNNLELYEHGLQAELGAYKRMVLLEWREVYDHDGTYARTARMLIGGGVPSVEDARRLLWLEPVLRPWRELVSPENLQSLIDGRVSKGKPSKTLLDETEYRFTHFLDAASAFGGKSFKTDMAQWRKRLETLLKLPALMEPLEPKTQTPDDFGHLRAKPGSHIGVWGTLLGYLFTESLEQPESGTSAIDEWLLGRVLSDNFKSMGLESGIAQRSVGLIKVLAAQPPLPATPSPKVRKDLIAAWLSDPQVQQYLRVNRFENQIYFNREAFEALLSASIRLVPVQGKANTKLNPWYGLFDQYRLEARKAGYKLEGLLPPVAQKPKKPQTKADPAKPASGTQKAAKPKPKPPISEPDAGLQAADAKETNQGHKKPATAKAAKPAKTRPEKLVSSTATPPAKHSKTTPPLASPKTKPAKETKPKPAPKDDLTVIEGIGPKMAAALEKAGIQNFKQLSKSSETELRSALAASDLRFAPSLPTWAEQASFLAKGDRAGFEKLTQQLIAGRKK